MSTIGIGVITYNRPEYLEQSIRGVMRHLRDLVDMIVVYNDGSDEKHWAKYSQAYDILSGERPKVIHSLQNHGVAVGKNLLLKAMLHARCDYIFLAEDDIVPMSPEAITGYIEAHVETGFEHLNFAHHGPMNPQPLKRDGKITFYPNCVGAWSFYTRHCIEEIGLFDEHFKNAWEHVEHTARAARAGLTSPFWMFADATGSEYWINEVRGSMQNSTIRQDDAWLEQIRKGLDYWKAKDGVGLPPKVEPEGSAVAGATMPSGVLVNPDGTLGSEVAPGPDAIRTLFDDTFALLSAVAGPESSSQPTESLPEPVVSAQSSTQDVPSDLVPELATPGPTEIAASETYQNGHVETAPYLPADGPGPTEYLAETSTGPDLPSADTQLLAPLKLSPEYRTLQDMGSQPSLADSWQEDELHFFVFDLASAEGMNSTSGSPTAVFVMRSGVDEPVSAVVVTSSDAPEQDIIDLQQPEQLSKLSSLLPSVVA